jgi:phosphoglycerate dehydrogenase-like enzyme
MAHIVVCLDMELPELNGWVKENIRPGFEARFLTVDSSDFWSTLPIAESLVLFESKITAEMIVAAKTLNLIQLPQVGCDNIDMAAATSAGIPVCNTPGVSGRSVAEHTLMLIFATLRRLVDCDASVRGSEWPALQFFQKGIHDLSGATLGIIGMGSIGKELAKICRPLAGEILYFRRHRLTKDEEQALEVTYAPMDELLCRSDVVSLHVPLNEDTRGMIGRRELSLMKRSAILVNAARGAVVDQDAFVEHMRAGRLMGAAFDVLWQEPPPPDSPLLTLENVVFTPHLGAASQEMQAKAFNMAFENVYRVAVGKEPLNRVLPKVS